MQISRAKIVCTLGPSSNTVESIRSLAEAGMNVARLNFSHGSQEDHRRMIKLVREVSAGLEKPIGIMADLQGPKIRVGRFAQGSVILNRGAAFTITTREVDGTPEMVSTTYKGLAADVEPGFTLLLDDGLLCLKVLSKNDTDVFCRVEIGGELKNNKGINIPEASLSVETLSEKDLSDTDFAIGEGVDFLALSFVRHPNDVLQMREILKQKKSNLFIVTKIEKPQAVEHIDAIIAASDGIMVARGDLGVEIPTEKVPGIQKMIIQKCNQSGVPVITATQMLDSMIHNPRPTRAEASDVANAILDGTDAVMLSGESASGKFPVEAVRMMRQIVEAIELENPPAFQPPHHRASDPPLPINEGVAISACSLADQVGARVIASITLSGSMSRAIARYRPGQPILAISQHEHVIRRLSLTWGVRGVIMPDLAMENVDDAMPVVKSLLLSSGLVKTGELFVLTAGLPFSGRQATNMVRVDRV